MEYYAFIHFSINTYTDMAWGFGNEDPKIFNPDKMDARQWAKICKEAIALAGPDTGITSPTPVLD